MDQLLITGIDKVVPDPKKLTLPFAMWLQEHFDELIAEETDGIYDRQLKHSAGSQ